MDVPLEGITIEKPFDKIFETALSHGERLETQRLDRFWLSKFLTSIGIDLESSHVTGVSDLFLQNLWQLLKGDDECIGFDEFWEIMTKVAVRRQQSTDVAERKRRLESEKASILATLPGQYSEIECLRHFLSRSVARVLEDSCGPGGHVSAMDAEDWPPLTQRVLQHLTAHVFEKLLLPLFARLAPEDAMSIEQFHEAIVFLSGGAAAEVSTELLEQIFDECNLYDTRGMPAGTIDDALELDEFVSAVMLYAVRSLAADTGVSTVQAKAWKFISDACVTHGLPPPPALTSDADFTEPIPRLCLVHPELVSVSDFGCFLLAGVFVPDVFAEAEARERHGKMVSASTLPTPARSWKSRHTVELSLQLHTDRFGRAKQHVVKHFAITVGGVTAKMFPTKRANRYRIEVPLDVKASGYHPCCTAAVRDDGVAILTRMVKSVVVASSEPSSPTYRLVLERKATMQIASQQLTATMERRYRALAKNPELGLTRQEFLQWFEQVRAAPRTFSLKKLFREQSDTPLDLLYDCYATAAGQAVEVSVDLEGYITLSRTPPAPANAAIHMTFPNTIAATWTTFMVCQGDVVPSAERFFDLSFDVSGPMAPPPMVTLPAISNLVVAPYTRAVHQRDVARTAAIAEATRVRVDYAHPNPLTHDQGEETPLSLAEKHGTISTSKEVLRANVRVMSESLKQEYFAQQMVRLL